MKRPSDETTVRWGSGKVTKTAHSQVRFGTADVPATARSSCDLRSTWKRDTGRRPVAPTEPRTQPREQLRTRFSECRPLQAGKCVLQVYIENSNASRPCLQHSLGSHTIRDERVWPARDTGPELPPAQKYLACLFAGFHSHSLRDNSSENLSGSNGTWYGASLRVRENKPTF